MASFPRELLGGHVRGSTRDEAPTRSPVDHGEAEVGEARLAAAIHHDVGRLQVPVDDPLVVDGGQARAQVAGEVQGLVRSEAPDPRQERIQVLPVDVLHGEEGLALQLHDVVKTAEVGVGDLAADPHLRVEPLQRFRRERAAHELEGNGLSELRVLGTVDLAHPSLAQKGDHAVAAGKNGARSESPLGGGHRGLASEVAALRPIGEVRRLSRAFAAWRRAVVHAWPLAFGAMVASPTGPG